MCVHCSATSCFKPVHFVLCVIEQDVSFKIKYFQLVMASVEMTSYQFPADIDHSPTEHVLVSQTETITIRSDHPSKFTLRICQLLTTFTTPTHQHCSSQTCLLTMALEAAFLTLAIHLAQATTCQGDNCTMGDYLELNQKKHCLQFSSIVFLMQICY